MSRMLRRFQRSGSITGTQIVSTFWLKMACFSLLLINLCGCVSFNNNVELYSGSQTFALLAVHHDKPKEQFNVVVWWLHLHNLYYDHEDRVYKSDSSPNEVAQSIAWAKPELIAKDLTDGVNYNTVLSTSPIQDNIGNMWREYFTISQTNNYIFTRLIENNQFVFTNRVEKNNIERCKETDYLTFNMGNDFYTVPHIPALSDSISFVSTIAVAPVIQDATNAYVFGWISIKDKNEINFNVPIFSSVTNQWKVIADQRQLSIKSVSKTSLLSHEIILEAKKFRIMNGRWPSSHKELSTMPTLRKPIPKNVSIESSAPNQCKISISKWVWTGFRESNSYLYDDD